MKEKKNSKVLRVGAFLLAVALLAIILVFANSMLGNPIAEDRAGKNAKAYVEKQYPGQGFEMKGVAYSFKDGGYHAFFEVPSSKDRHFSVHTDGKGSIQYDDYDSLKEGYNTYFRLDAEYKDLVRPVTEVFSPEDEEKEDERSGFAYGTLLENSGMGEYQVQELKGLDHAKLVIDKEYDIQELGKAYGQIVWVDREEEVSYEKAKDQLLDLKARMDQAGLSFASVDYSLDSKKLDSQGEGISISGIRYDQIEDSEDFLQLLKELQAKQKKIYEQMDKDK